MNGTLNKVMLIGNLGNDVKMHYFEGGNSIGRFSLATNEAYTNKEGNKIANVEWHNIIVRNKLAELCEKYLIKGDKIYCEGRIKSKQWISDDGVTHYTVEIHVNEITFLSNKKQESTKKDTSIQEDLKTKQIDKPEENDGLPF
jgi:single-strand DNA-binding protein